MILRAKIKKTVFPTPHTQRLWRLDSRACGARLRRLDRPPPTGFVYKYHPGYTCLVSPLLLSSFYIFHYVFYERINQGLKYLKISTTHREGRWRGRRPRARHGGAKRRSAEGVGSAEGRSSPSPVWGSGGIAPRKF